MHNPKAGDAKHGKKELMAALAKAGHHAIYQSTKKSDYKKALKKSTDLVIAAGGDGTVAKVATLESREDHGASDIFLRPAVLVFWRITFGPPSMKIRSAKTVPKNKK